MPAYYNAPRDSSHYRFLSTSALLAFGFKPIYLYTDINPVCPRGSLKLLHNQDWFFYAKVVKHENGVDVFACFIELSNTPTYEELAHNFV